MADLYSCWVISLRKQQDFYGCEAQCIGGSKPNARSATLVQWRQFSLAFLLKLKQIYMYYTVTMPYLAASLVSVLPCSSQVFLCLNPVFFFFFVQSIESRIPVSHEISLDHGNKTVEYLIVLC